MRVGTRVVGGVALVLALATLSACSKPEIKLTECVDGVPAKPRIHDVAPPNCTGP